jgi:iron-sulfur cluster repair protein YtfE (RIC family)
MGTEASTKAATKRGTQAETEADLRELPASRVQTAAFYEVKDLAAGEAVVLITAEDPKLVMESLNLQLRDALAWETQASPEGFRTRVVLREETEPADVVDLLIRDHHRVDELLAKALRRINAADVAGARPLLEAFAARLRRHIRVENEILAPMLPQPVGMDGTSHAAVMLREHDEVLAQLAEVEASLAFDAAPEAWEVEPFVAILSGTLAKHEHREESNLFPHWAAALRARPAAEQQALLARVRAMLEGVDREP